MNDDLQSLIDQAVQQSAQNGAITTTDYVNYNNTDVTSWVNGFSTAAGMWWSWVIALILIVAQWTIFDKAGKPGWAAIVPIYNTIVFLQVVNRPWWWIFLFLIPGVNLVFAIMAIHQLSLAFKKGVGFTIGILFLPFIFLPILAFSADKYHKPA